MKLSLSAGLAKGRSDGQVRDIPAAKRLNHPTVSPFIMTTSSKTAAFRLFMAIACLAAVSLPCHAARKARAIFIQPSDRAPEKAMLFTGKDYSEIELPQRNLSAEVDLPDGDLVLAVLPGKLAGNAKVPADAPTIKIPAAWGRCLLLFFPDPSNKTFPARVIPVNASSADFAKGHTLIYNVSSAAIIGKFGEQVIKVLPGKSATMKPPIAEFGAYPVDIDCYMPGDKKPTSLCRSNWQHDPDARQIMFVTPAPGYNVPRVWGILDRSLSEAEDKKQR